MRRGAVGIATAVVTVMVAVLLAAVAPAGAAFTIVTESGATVTVRNNNDVIVRGTPGDDSFFIVNGFGPGEVGIAVGSDSPESIVVSLVPRNILMLGLGGNDRFEHRSGVVPGNVTFDGGPGNDVLGVSGGPAPAPDVQGLLMMNGGAQADAVFLTDADYSGRVTIRGGIDADFDSVSVSEATIADRLDIRPGPGVASVSLDSVSVGSFAYIGSSDVDNVFIIASTLGPRPRLRTAGGHDNVDIAAEWTGALSLSLGSGNDGTTIRRAEDPEVAETTPRFLLNAGPGDDRAEISTGFDPASVANGSSGSDTLFTAGGFVIRSFETVDMP